MKIIYVISAFILLQVNNVVAQEKVDAVIDWAHRVDLIIPVDGIVNKVHVAIGQKVNKGQVLVELDKRVFLAELAQAKANVRSLKSSYDEVKRELSRALELYDRTVLSDHDLQVAKNNEVNANAHLEKSKAEYVKAKINLELAALTAPFNGIVLKRNVEVGQAIINKFSYTPLITLVSSNEYLVKTNINKLQTENLSIGKPVSVTVNKKIYNGKIVAIEFGAETAKGQYQVGVKFMSDDSHIHPGSKAQVDL